MKKYYPKHINLLTDFFSGELVKSTYPSRKAKVVTSIAMFYDLKEPVEFMKQVYDILDDEGIWLLEQSYLPTMLKQTAYDTVCHEHLEYYGLNAGGGRRAEHLERRGRDRCEVSAHCISTTQPRRKTTRTATTLPAMRRRPRQAFSATRPVRAAGSHAGELPQVVRGPALALRYWADQVRAADRLLATVRSSVRSRTGSPSRPAVFRPRAPLEK